MLSVREVTALLEILQNSSQTLESAASAFQRAFIKAEHFRVAAALCILIEDGLLPATKQRATALFIIIPTSFLIVLFVKSQSEENVSGGFSQKYYDESKKAGNKKTNEAARLKGAGIGMRPSK